jgi:hypothetical protein
MLEDEIVELGAFASIVMQDPRFTALTKAFEVQTVDLMLATAPSEVQAREKQYARLNGVRDFLGFLADFASKAIEIQQANMPKPEDNDDPSVHNIYRTDDQEG